MPRPRDPAAHITAAVQDLLGSITRLIESATTSVANGKQRTPRVSPAAPTSAKSAKIRRAVKASWANYTPAERVARIHKMLAGRGLKPKAAVKRGAALRRMRQTPKSAPVRKRTPPRKARVNAWAKLSPAERSARVAKMRAGRRAASPPHAPIPAGA